MKPKKEQPKDDKITCPHCLGTGEVVDANEEDDFFSETCTLCLGGGKIEKTASYKDPFDLEDEEELDYE
jgi:DnaJ-class molecular chaperone